MSTSDDFTSKLDAYTQIVVSMGLNLRAGQRLVIRTPIAAAPFVRLVAANAYRSGARLVDVFWNDEQITLARFQYAPRDSFEEYPAWAPKALEQYAQNGDAFLSIYAEDPTLLKDQDPALIEMVSHTAMKVNHPFSTLIESMAINWCVVSIPIPSWSKKVYPELSEQEGIDHLWDAIFKVCRIDQPDPVAAWHQHIQTLIARCDALNQTRFTALKYTGPGTDLTIGLPEGHTWLGGRTMSKIGIPFIPNMPTDEVFTLPHKDRVDGVVHSTKPLPYAGNVIEDFSITFERGRVVSFSAAKGENVLKQIIETDEGAHHLGEVALVPTSAPVAASNIMFFNALYDENAACHLALGAAYRDNLPAHQDDTDEDFASAGGNNSMNHVDFMVGSSHLDIDGITAEGASEAVMRAGEWAVKI